MASHLTKSEIVDKVFNGMEGVTRTDVRDIIDLFVSLVQEELGKHHEFVVPGVVKLSTKHQKAKPRRRGINPFTKEEQWFKAKPAKTVVKARALKAVKDAAND